MCNAHLAFSASVSLKFRWCSHIIVLIQAHFGKNSRFIFSDRLDFHMFVNLPIAVYGFPQCILTSLSIDEILLPTNMNWPTYFRGLSINEKMATSYLKHMNSVLME